MDAGALVPCLWTAGVVQLAIFGLNLVLPRVLDYRGNLARASRIVRQVFFVHSLYVGLVLLGAGALSLAFAPELAAGSALGRSLSGFLLLFWLLRLGIQLLYYDRALRKRHRAVDVTLAASFAFLATVYAACTVGVRAA